ncbi:small multidrug resistance protein [Lactiplantibacillus plantarum]|uniref:small multidrug resistance protein n=1 Tax=Lactiplantibacillus plantarum TaxID=1590 RepID=UPI003EB75C48
MIGLLIALVIGLWLLKVICKIGFKIIGWVFMIVIGLFLFKIALWLGLIVVAIAGVALFGNATT